MGGRPEEGEVQGKAGVRPCAEEKPQLSAAQW